MNHWETVMKANRAGVTRVLAAVKAGKVDEEDFERLRNFCMIALMMQGKLGEVRYREAARAAEIASLFREGRQDENS